jgi:hypothetical protein
MLGKRLAASRPKREVGAVTYKGVGQERNFAAVVGRSDGTGLRRQLGPVVRKFHLANAAV